MKVPLTQGKFAIVDAADWPATMKHKWTAYQYHRTWYAVRGLKKVYMHRWLLDAPKNTVVGHLNGDGLDNRRMNLRLLSNAECQYKQRLHTRGSSQYRGVHLTKYGRYVATYNTEHKGKYIGTFENEEDAAHAYDDTVRELWGDLARTNF